MSADQGILVFIAPIVIEENLVDFLLDREHEYGFSSERISGHTEKHGAMSMTEQVTGRQRRVRFEVQTTATEAQDVIRRLEELFRGAGIHYWFTPVTLSGHLD
jgi:hypothetical protein